MPSLLFHSAFFNAPFILVLGLVLTLVAAAIYDVKTYTIPHVFSYIVLALFVVNIGVTSPNLTMLSWHLLSVIIAFAIGFLLFVGKLMGGGDVKLFAALALWFFPLGLVGLIFSITTIGALLSIGIAGYGLAASHGSTGSQPSLMERVNALRKKRIPYGPAIATGTILYLILSKNLGL